MLDPRYSVVSLCLAEALEDDPFYAAIIVESALTAVERRARLRDYFHYSLVEGEQLGLTTVPQANFGAAIWHFPQPQARTAQLYAQKVAFLAPILGTRGLSNYEAMIAFMAPYSEACMGLDAWYLSILGVAPQFQNQGLGRTLIESTLMEADHARATCYLETFSARNFGFYNRLGFIAVESHLEPITGATYWIMARKPS